MKLIVLLGVMIAAAMVRAETPRIALREGDCWSYATRPGEADSYLVIRKLTPLRGGKTVASISVLGLRLKSPDAPGGVLPQIVCLQIWSDALTRSLRERIDREVPELDWQKGYAFWWERYGSRGKGGASSEAVRDLLDQIVRQLAETANEGRQS